MGKIRAINILEQKVQKEVDDATDRVENAIDLAIMLRNRTQGDVFVGGTLTSLPGVLSRGTYAAGEIHVAFHGAFKTPITIDKIVNAQKWAPLNPERKFERFQRVGRTGFAEVFKVADLATAGDTMKYLIFDLVDFFGLAPDPLGNGDIVKITIGSDHADKTALLNAMATVDTSWSTLTKTGTKNLTGKTPQDLYGPVLFPDETNPANYPTLYNAKAGTLDLLFKNLLIGGNEESLTHYKLQPPA